MPDIPDLDKPHPPIWLVEWKDSMMVPVGWKDAEDMTDALDGHRMLHRSVGFLWESNENYVSLYMSQNDDHENFHGGIVIPKGCIVNITCWSGRPNA